MRDATDFLNSIVDAWEALPGGRQVRNSDVERWLAADMDPAINAIRGFLRRPRPDGVLPPPPETNLERVIDAAERLANAAKRAGAGMANICFNLSQQTHQSATDRQSMKTCQVQWDAAIRALTVIDKPHTAPSDHVDAFPDTFDRLKAIIVECVGVDDWASITPDAALVEDVGLDSLDTVEIVMEAEEHFGVEIDDADIAVVVTMQDAVNAVDKARAALASEGQP